jgi:hypothetical protein
MGKSKTTNVSTSWVPFEFGQTDLTKAQKEGLIAEGDQVVFPSTERIPKPPSGYRVMFLAFSFTAYPFLPINFSADFSLLTAYSFTSSCQTRFYTLLALSLFASLFWGSNPIGFFGNFSSASALVLLCRRSLSWAGQLFLSTLRFITVTPQNRHLTDYSDHATIYMMSLWKRTTKRLVHVTTCT